MEPEWMKKPASPIPEWALYLPMEEKPEKPIPPNIVVMKEGVVPGEDPNLAYLVTGSLVLGCIIFSPLLLAAWLTGWAWHRISRMYSGNKNINSDHTRTST